MTCNNITCEQIFNIKVAYKSSDLDLTVESLKLNLTLDFVCIIVNSKQAIVSMNHLYQKLSLFKEKEWQKVNYRVSLLNYIY